MNQFDYTAFFGKDFQSFFSNLPTVQDVPFDTDALMELQRRNFQALTEAQQLAVEGLQAVAQRQSEIIAQMVEDNSAIARDIISEGSPEQKVAKHTDLVKKVYERSVTNYREISDMLEKSGQEAADIINKRISASLNELKSAMEKSAPAKTKKAA